MPLRRPIRLLLLVCLAGAAPAGDADPLSPRLTVNLWRLRPSEVVQELNLRLPPYQRLAWYVNRNTDGLVNPGPMLSAEKRSLREILTNYCEATELAFDTATRAVWIYRPAPADAAAAWQAALRGDDADARAEAIVAILDQPDPKGIKLLIGGLATNKKAVRRDCYRALARLLGASGRGFERQSRMCLDIFSGNLPHLYRPIAVMDEYGEEVPAPWVWARIALKDQAAHETLEHVCADADLVNDLPLLVLACAAKLPASKQALKQRSEKDVDHHGGWVQNWVKGYAGRVSRWLDDDGVAEARPVEQYTKTARDAVAAIIGPEVQREIDALRPKAKRLKQEYDRVKREGKDKATVKQAEKAYKQVQNRVNQLKKKLDQRDKNNVKQVERLTSVYGDPAIRMLMEMVTNDEYYIGLRQLALQKARHQLRSPAMIPGLVQLLEESKAPELKMTAGRMLGLLRCEEGLEILRRQLDNPDSLAIRKSAAIGLALSHAADAFGLLRERLDQTEKSEERLFLLQAMGWTRDPEAVDFLLEHTRNGPVIQERKAAVYGLSVMRDRRIQDLLVDVISDSDRSLMLRQAAVEGLKPRNVQEAHQFLPILLEALPDQKIEEIGVAIINAIWTGAKYVNSGSDLKRELGTRCAQMVADTSMPTRVRMHLLNVFKHTDNTREAIAILQGVLDKEKNPISKRFLSIAVANAKKNQVE